MASVAVHFGPLGSRAPTNLGSSLPAVLFMDRRTSRSWLLLAATFAACVIEHAESSGAIVGATYGSFPSVRRSEELQPYHQISVLCLFDSRSLERLASVKRRVLWPPDGLLRLLLELAGGGTLSVAPLSYQGAINPNYYDQARSRACNCENASVDSKEQASRLLSK